MLSHPITLLILGGTGELASNFAISSKLTEGRDIATVGDVSYCYAGYSGHTNLGLKVGTSDYKGMITFNLSETTATKLNVVGIGWKTSDKISVGETSYTSAYAYNAKDLERICKYSR